jgi:hypothetical protein
MIVYIFFKKTRIIVENHRFHFVLMDALVMNDKKKTLGNNFDFFHFVALFLNKYDCVNREQTVRLRKL